MEFTATDGRTVRLCDFASAGVGGTPYRSWLKIKDVPDLLANESTANQRGEAMKNLYALSFHLELTAREPLRWGMAKSPSKKAKAMMMGVGLDTDGHKRVTSGPNFALVGGSQETHEQMTEKAIKINEKLARKGKTLENVTHEEMDDIAQSVGLRRHEPPHHN